MSKRKKNPLKDFLVDVEFHSIPYHIKARTAAEAKKKIKRKIQKGVALRHIKNMYII